MQDPFYLECDDCRLELEIVNESRWCKVKLKEGDSERELGAEEIGYIANHLIEILENKGKSRKPSGEIDGKECFWVLSLMEKHNSIYAQFQKEKVCLHFQDHEANFFKKFWLSKQKQEEWKEKLYSLL